MSVIFLWTLELPQERQKKNKSYFNFEHHWPNDVRSLAEFHAFTGCNYTSAFIRKDKNKPFYRMERNIDIQQAFKELATSGEITQTTTNTLKFFTATIYGAREVKYKTLNEHRFKTFEKACRPKASSSKP